MLERVAMDGVVGFTLAFETEIPGLSLFLVFMVDQKTPPLVDNVKKIRWYHKG